MKRFLILACMLLLPVSVRAGMVPDAAYMIAGDLDSQLVERLQLTEGPAKGQTLIMTVPVNLGDLETSSPLARLMAEEIAEWFVKAGYRVQEVRKGRTLLFDPGTGEMLLTRRTDLLYEKNVHSALVLTGTYTTTSKHVRFNIRLLHAPSNEVLAMSSQTIPIIPEMTELLSEEGGRAPIRPSVSTAITRPMVMGRE